MSLAHLLREKQDDLEAYVDELKTMLTIASLWPETSNHSELIEVDIEYFKLVAASLKQDTDAIDTESWLDEFDGILFCFHKINHWLEHQKRKLENPKRSRTEVHQQAPAAEFPLAVTIDLDTQIIEDSQ